MVLILILAFLILICVVKVLNNDDIAKQCIKTEKDKANIKNARKVYSTGKESLVFLITAIVSLIVIMLLNFTNIEYAIKDFISTEIISPEKHFSYYYYLIPIYILVCRQIMIEVKISEFIYKFFNVEEPELEENLVKTLLYKKTPSSNNNQPNTSQPIVTPATVPQNVELPKEEQKKEE